LCNKFSCCLVCFFYILENQSKQHTTARKKIPAAIAILYFKNRK